jgi:Mn2+/Fe2+ NRAMP family transporter
MLKRVRALARDIGPGIVSGFSDNDPTTVATLAVIGASTMYGLTWLVLLVIPMLAVVQSIAARIGAVSHHGLEHCIRFRYGRLVALVALLAVLGVNLITLAADLEGGGAALALLTGIDYRWWIVPFAVLTALLLVFARYKAISKFLELLALIFVAYIFAAFLAHPNWADVLRGSLVPHFEYTDDYISGTLALLGTTLTAYAYVWESIETSVMGRGLHRIGLLQVDAAIGIVLAGISFWFIVVATGATLGVHHRHVETAQDAASALAPIAGRYASIVFGVGLLGSALLAVPVLAGTSAYVLSEALNWQGSLDADFRNARRFYSALLASLVIGAAIAFAGASPIKLLFASGIAGGIATPLTLGLMMLVARDRKIMGRHRVGNAFAFTGWATTAVVLVASGVYLYRTITT